MLRVQVALLLSLSYACCTAGCSPPVAHSESSSTPSLSLSAKQGQHCTITYGDQKDPDSVEGTIGSVNDQWIVLKDVSCGPTFNNVESKQEVWVPAQKVQDVKFDPVLPGEKN